MESCNLNEPQITLPMLTDEPIYQQLKKYFNDYGTKLNLKELFQSDKERFKKFR